MKRKRDGRFVQCGRDVSVIELEEIQETVALFPGLSLTELVRTICEHLQWYSASGGLKQDACLKLLQKMETAGLLTLPEKRLPPKPGPTKAPALVVPTPQGSIEGPLRTLGSVRLVPVQEKAAVTLWRSYLEGYHYLGDTKPIGCFVRYFIESERGKLGCLLFSGAAKALRNRDRWIGWRDEERLRQLGLVANNSRYLIFPWVKVKNLASHVLGQVERRLGEDWEQRWNYRPVLLETFVDPERYAGTCYKAANWRYLGMTTGRGLSRKGKSYTTSPKKIFVRPLADDFRTALCA